MAFPQSENLPIQNEGRKFYLNWLNYLILMRISNKAKHLTLSRDKDEVMRLALEGQVIESPEDVLKILMFWNLQGFRKWHYIRKRQLL